MLLEGKSTVVMGGGSGVGRATSLRIAAEVAKLIRADVCLKRTKAAAIEGAPFGIRCTAICPAGMPYTNFTNAMGMTVSEEDKEQMAAGVGSMHPLGRPILAEDCAEAAVYLVSDMAKNVTGAL